MSNTELTKHYLSMSKLPFEEMPETSYYNIIPALDKHFGKDWTWELVDEKFAMDNTVVCTTVMVYIPGRVFTGRSLCKVKDYHVNHLFAIMDACQSFTKVDRGFSLGAAPVNKPSDNIPNNAPMQMTPEQITQALSANNNDNQQINNIAQLDNYKENGMPCDEVPFDKMTDQCHQQQAEQMMPQTSIAPVQQNTQQPQNVPAGYDDPQPKYKGFSQHQVDRMNKFKEEFEIQNNAMFDNYVNTWDNRLSGKMDLTPSNVDAFLNWAEDLGKMGC